MGMLAAVELANKVQAGTLSLTDAVAQHFSTGFVRPIRSEWIPVCVSIIERYKGGDHDLSYEVHVPGKDNVLVTAESIIEDLHLDAFSGELESEQTIGPYEGNPE